MINQTQGVWTSSFLDPSLSRLTKPRVSGITMIIDKGLGLTAFCDLLETASSHIDYIKLGFGTSVLYPSAVLQEKIKQARSHHVRLYPGGTFFEVAYSQGKLSEYYQDLQECGFDTVEISDGSIALSYQERTKAIQMAKEMELQVITECGKKESGSFLSMAEIKETLHHDLECGAHYMIVEGRESGQNVGIYNEQGHIDSALMHRIEEELQHWSNQLIWEAPHKHQQVQLIKRLGPNVNLGNIAVHDAYSVESLRRGLRSDTFFGKHM